MKKHTCPACAAPLRINTKLQMYECPFCGVTYDYEYFREDDVLDRAERALRAGEYNSAAEAYDFMLTKEPHNFVALRGKIMVSAKAKSMHEFRDPNRLRSLNYSKINTEIDQAIFASENKSRDYFSKLKELVAAGKEYKDVIMNITKRREQRKLQGKKIQYYTRAKTQNYVDIGDKNTEVSVHPKDLISAAIVMYIIWCLLVVIMSLSIFSVSTTSTTTTNYYYVRHGNNIDVMIMAPSLNSDQMQALDPEYINSAREEIIDDSGLDEEIIVYRDPETKAKKEAEKKAKEEEEERAEKKKAQDRAGRIAIVAFLIVVPGIACAIYCMYMKKKLKQINKIEHTINVYSEQASEISDQILTHESEAVSIRRKISLLYKELTEIDPVPDMQNMPIEKRPGIARRWQ